MSRWACRLAMLAMALALASVPASGFRASPLAPASTPVTADWPNPLGPVIYPVADWPNPLSPVSI